MRTPFKARVSKCDLDGLGSPWEANPMKGMAPDAQAPEIRNTLELLEVIAESFAALVKQNPMGMGHQCSQPKAVMKKVLRWWQSMEEVSTEDEDLGSVSWTPSVVAI